MEWLQEQVGVAACMVHPMRLMAIMEMKMARWARRTKEPRKTWLQALGGG